MNRIWRTAIVSLIIMCMSLTSVYAQAMELRYDGGVYEYNLEPITLYINGDEIDTSAMPPIQFGGTTLVPVREVFEPLGADVVWNSYEKRVYISYEDKLIVLEMDSEYASVNGEAVKMSMASKIINDKIMVPVRFISEELGFDVLWENDTRCIYITAPEEEPDSPDEPNIPDEPSKPNAPEVPEWDFDEILRSLNGVEYFYKGDRGTFTNYVEGQSNSGVTITNVVVNEGNNRATVTINSNGRITDIKPLILDGRIVIDIQNSTNNLSSSITVNNNSYVESIRTSQYESNVTRVVIDLKSGASADMTLSPDRSSIIVEITNQPVQGIVVGKDSTSDYVYIDGLSPELINVDENRVLDEIALTLPNMQLDESILWNDLNGEFIKEVSVVQKGNNTEVVVKVEGSENYVLQTTSHLNGTMLRISEPTYRNIAYRNGSIYIEKPDSLSVNQIKVDDNYRERELVIDLGANYEWFFGYGKHEVGDSIVKTIDIETTGTTKLIVDEQTIHAFNIIDLGNQVQIELVKPKEKYDKILVLDSGHGGNDPGAIGNGIQEKIICQIQTEAVRALIEKETDIKVYMTREADTTLTLAFRTDLANEIEADMFVSIHNNSGPTSATGTEVLYYPSTTDARGQQLAQMVQTNIVNYTGMYNRGIKARSDLYVLRTSNMPAILIEGGFLSNPSDAAKLNSAEFTAQYARAVTDAIVEAFETMSFR